MIDQRIEKLAKLCVEYSVQVKPKEEVLIQGSDLAFPLIHEIYKECLLADAYPTVNVYTDTEYIFFKYAKEHQLKHVPPIAKFRVENVDVQISIFCEPNPKNLSNIDSSKMRTRSTAIKEITDIFFKRESEGKLRWTSLPFPTSSAAQEASMALSEYEDFVLESCLLNKKDPIAQWKKIQSKQKTICDRLNKASEIHVIGEDTDLKFKVKGRKWVNCCGQKNMPDGEVFTGPIENSAEGRIRFTFPGIYYGKEVEDISLTFNKGKVVKASAEKGEELLKEILKVENADRLGETAIGTNYGITRFTKEMLFDEKIGGTIHMALGRSIPESGGTNQSSIHWDILKDMRKNGEIYADEELFYEKGKFLT
jgi:aminopeptidase